jgi:GNAT superfamily N-acetyltransferase
MIRRARRDDAEAIARVHIRTWQTAYSHVFPAAALAGLALEPRVRSWNELLALDDSGIFVSESNGAVTGFVSVGASRDAEREGELYAIYVVPEAWGTGAGRELIAAGEEWLRANGYGSATLWVLDDNPRARRFYENAGWTVDGSLREGEHLGVRTTEVRYRKPLRGR